MANHLDISKVSVAFKTQKIKQEGHVLAARDLSLASGSAEFL